MPGPLATPGLIFAQVAQKAAAPAGKGGATGWLGSYEFLLYIAVIGLWFYLLLIRPNQRQEKQRKSMLGALKKNDRVLTSAGIYGTVVGIDDASDKVTVRIDDDKGVKVGFTRASIVRIFDGSENTKDKDKDGS